MYYICELNFFGQKEIFSSTDKIKIKEELIRLNADTQPIMMDSGYMLCTSDDILNINKFIQEVQVMIKNEDIDRLSKMLDDKNKPDTNGIRKTSYEMTEKIKAYAKTFEVNYVMESSTHYILYGKSQGKGNNCKTMKLPKDIF